MKYFVLIGAREVEVEVDGDHVIVDGKRLGASLAAIPGSPVRQLLLDGQSHAFPMQPLSGGRWAVTAHGERHEVEVVDERSRHIRGLTAGADRSAAPRQLKAPMPGLVSRVQVSVGEQVAAGAPLVVLEAMKMENQLKASAAATVTVIRVSAGEAVEKGQVLLEFGDPAT